jgi:hypothetical protein
MEVIDGGSQDELSHPLEVITNRLSNHPSVFLSFYLLDNLHAFQILFINGS